VSNLFGGPWQFESNSTESDDRLSLCCFSYSCGKLHDIKRGICLSVADTISIFWRSFSVGLSAAAPSYEIQFPRGKLRFKLRLGRVL
jgi:hypothetical protein